MEETSFALTLNLHEGYRMSVDFGSDLPELELDEDPPLGDGAAPNPARLLGSAIGGCLGSSLLYCLRRARASVDGLSIDVRGRFDRNDRGHCRLTSMVVTLRPEIHAEEKDRLVRCISVFEEYCVVSESVRRGIPIEIEVDPVVIRPATAVPG